MMNKVFTSERLLSKREIEILKLIAFELSTKEIARVLFVSSETVKTHRKNIFLKLKVKNVAGAVRVAYQSRILKLEENYPQAS